MSNTSKAVGAGAVVLSGALILGLVCGSGGFSAWQPGTTQEQPDCDAGDLRESKPDPDCGGLWLGTPTPSTRSTPGAVRRTPAVKKTR